MAAVRKRREPPRPLALAEVYYPDAWWDGRVWRDGPYWYDEGAADAAVRFFPDKLRLTKGEWAGQPFTLEAWQEHDIVRPLFGWKRADGTRRYRRAYVWIPRKNGKSELAAGIALLVLVGDGEEGGEVYTIASDKNQAKIVFNTASTMVAKGPLVDDLECFKTAIYCSELNASIIPLSGKPEGKHGYNASGLIGDEIHEWPNGDLYQFIHDSEAARRQPLEFLISTAGEKGTYAEEVYGECESILKGDIDDPETLVRIWAANDNDDWTDPAVHARVNPNWGRSVKPDSFNADLRRARQLPRLANAFKRYRLNMWTEQATLWLPLDALNDEDQPFGWDHCQGPTDWRELEAKLLHKRCFGGLDLSSTTDLTALVWWFPIQEGLDTPACLARFWKPAALLEDHGKRDKLPYKDWVASGAMFSTPGNVMDYRAIRAQIDADLQRFRIAYRGENDRKPNQGGLAIDRWNATETAVQLQDEGLPVVLFGQGFASMSPPAKELERLVMCNGFHHGGHPVLRQHAKTVAVEQDAAENIKPSKDKSSHRIDGIVALCMALGIAATDTGPKRSVYEQRGVRMI